MQKFLCNKVIRNICADLYKLKAEYHAIHCKIHKFNYTAYFIVSTDLVHHCHQDSHSNYRWCSQSWLSLSRQNRQSYLRTDTMRLLQATNIQITCCTGTHFRYRCEWNMRVHVKLSTQMSLCQPHWCVNYNKEDKETSLAKQLTSTSGSMHLSLKITHNFKSFPNLSNTFLHILQLSVQSIRAYSVRKVQMHSV